jgi:hypothetical protein
MDMRVALAALLVASAWACAHGTPPSPLPVEGAWQSDRARTLDSLQAARPWPVKQWRLLSDPTLFGHMVKVYRGSLAFIVFEGKCSDPVVWEAVESGMRVEDSLLYVPIAMLRGRPDEVFRRISIEEAIRQHPCVAEVLARMESSPEAE